MQTSIKKRKIETDEDDDWGTEFTAEEFDLLQSQIEQNVAAPTTIAPITNTQLNPTQIEEQHVLEGEIRMLRQSLQQKEADLRKEQTERDQLIAQKLKEHGDEKKQLLLNMEKLKSALTFKEHELKCEQAKVKAIEQRAKLPLKTDPCKFSPTKVLPVSLKKFPNRPCATVHAAIQTECNEAKNVNAKFLLECNSAYSFHNLRFSSVGLDSSLSSASIPPCKVLSESSKSVYKSPATSLIRNGMPFGTRKLCFCQAETDHELLTKELHILGYYESELRQYIDKLNVYQVSVSESSGSSCSSPLSKSSRLSGLSKLTETVSLLLSELCNFFNTSQSACDISLKSFKENMNLKNENSDKVLTLMVRCCKPFFGNGQLLNKSVINYALTALVIVSDRCGDCCSGMLNNLVEQLNICKLLDGSCSPETANLSLAFLNHCVGLKTCFVHEKDACVYSSLEKYLRTVFNSKASTSEQIKCCASCLRLLTNVIDYHSITVICSEQCYCVAHLLNQVFKWVYRRDVYDENVILSLFHLVQLLYKFLTADVWFNLRARLNDCFVLTLTKVCNSNELYVSTLKEVILELWEHENTSHKLSS